MLTDPMTRLLNDGHMRRKVAREAAVKAATSHGDAELRRAAALRVWSSAQHDLAQMRARLRPLAAGMAEKRRANLFDLTGNQHAHSNPAIAYPIQQRSRAFADSLTDASQACEAMAVLLRRPDAEGGLALFKAGFVAERAHREGWTDVVAAWLATAPGRQRGGHVAYAALVETERYAAGEVPPALQPLPPLDGAFPGIPLLAERVTPDC